MCWWGAVWTSGGGLASGGLGVCFRAVCCSFWFGLVVGGLCSSLLLISRLVGLVDRGFVFGFGL